MKLMKKLKIGGAEYKVIRGKETEEEYVGYHDYHRGIIKISKTHSGEVRNDRLILETVLHEVIHAVSSVWLDDRLTEKAVTKLSLALFAFFADNDLMLRSKEIPKQVKYMGFIYDLVYPVPDGIEIDVDSRFSVSNTKICKIYITFDDDDCVYYIKSLLLRTILKMVIDLYGGFSESEVDDIYDSNFYQGLYQAIVDNKIDELIYKGCNK
uniref:Peptidase n=1 Tax=viral metagenome TaxID=1070528 RepID=A0A6M3JE33_9ZZZZ